MNDALLRLYHRLPSPARSAAASVQGWRLRSWRYGAETDALVDEALGRERWTTEQWRIWRDEQVAQVLHRAATRVPYYRDHWQTRRRNGDTASWEVLANWPILRKETLRAQPHAFVADDRQVRRMYHERTSGTTGTPLDVWWSRDTVRRYFALWEARTRVWNGVSRRDHWAMMGGQPVVSARTTRPPLWVWNAPMHQLYLSANHVSRRNARAYVEAMRNRHITHLVTYASTAAVLAGDALDLGVRVDTLRVLITNAEPLLPWQREVIRAGLGCEVRETYGMAEIVAAASECEAGAVHLWPEVGAVETVDGGSGLPTLPGAPGELVCTSLLNTDMPLVRFAVGDRGAMAAEQECPCGRGLPIVASIEGRTNDLLVARDGRRVYWVNPIFYGLPVRQAQVVQDAVAHVCVRYVAAPGFTQATEQAVAARLHDRLGDVEVSFEAMERIPHESNGKFKAVRCDVPLERFGDST